MNNLKILLAASTAAVFACAAAPAFAQAAQGLYVTADGGASFLPDLHLKDPGTVRESFDTGYAAGGAVGYDTGDGTRIEIDSNYAMSNLNKLGGAPANGHLDSTSVMINGQVDLVPHSQVTPYAGVGVGYEDIGADVAGIRDHDWKPAYQAEAGLRDDVTKHVSVFGEYRFAQSEAADLSDAGVSAHQHFADHGLLAGLTYRLGE